MTPRAEEELRARLAEAEEALRAIRQGQVDAVVIPGPAGDVVYTLRGSDHAYRTLVERMSEGAAMLDADGVILFGNRRLAQLLGRGIERVVGTRLGEHVPAAEREGLDLRLRRAREAEDRGELSLEAADGGRVATQAAFSAAVIDGRPVLCLVLTDLAERKRSEEAVLRLNAELVAANKELEAFAYSVSHDLRAPLRAIDGFSQALLEDCEGRLDEVGRSHLARVRGAAQRMGQLIDDLLGLSRLSRAELVRAPTDVTALAEGVTAELRAAEPGRDVAVHVAPGLRVQADPRLLRIVLVNLLDNAWKFTARQPRATIEVGAARRDGQPALFVRDDGAGFDPEYAHRLFTPFQRLHAATEFPGTGIGLAMVQRIVHRHGGRVWLEGVVDGGATCTFTLGGEEAP